MTQSHTGQPPYSPPPASPPSNALATTGFVLGLIGLVFSPIPVVGVIAWPLVILGLIFSAIGLSRATKRGATNKGLAITGLVLSLIGLAICIVWAAAFTKAANDVNRESHRVATIQYQVTGNAKNASITYTTFGDNLNTSQETAAALPWSKEVRTSGLIKGGSLVVTADATGGTVTCTVTVDGKQAKTNTATGPFATATCSDF